MSFTLWTEFVSAQLIDLFSFFAKFVNCKYDYNTAVPHLTSSTAWFILFQYIAENEIEVISPSKQEEEAATIATPPTAIETKYSAFRCLYFFRFSSLQPSANTFRRVNVNGRDTEPRRNIG